MTCFVLTTPREADSALARLFATHSTCELEVREDKAFKDGGWLALGNIQIDTGAGTQEALKAAVRRGAFEWRLPDLAVTTAALGQLLGVQQPDTAPKIRRILDAAAAITLRAGLQHPRLDPNALDDMPFKRSTTIVADTSGAVQGGLDFVARYLHPAARVKVPAIVQMEIVNFAERFLRGRRSSKTHHADLLIDHLMSQGGQRVLLRLELQADTEIERTFLLGDPLRSAFQEEKEQDLRNLNLSVSIRAYVDRLVLESARQHQAHVSPGHQVQLLTSDQGLARMALAEGITPLFFSSVVAEDAFGKRLTGTILDPFRGVLRQNSLASLLWELATAFGSVKLRALDGTHAFSIAAIGETMSWSPYQSHADLLWCDHDTVPNWNTAPSSKIPNNAETAPALLKAARAGKPGKLARKAGQKGTGAGYSLQRFNVDRLFQLIDLLDTYQSLTADRMIETVGAKNAEGIEEYRRFLLSAGLAAIDGQDWKATESNQRLAVALRNEAVAEVEALLLQAPSFALFAKQLHALPIGQTWEPSDFRRTATTYRTLGEVCCICAPIAGEGVYPTPTKPTVEEFAPIALERFRTLDVGEGLVATGAWLEALIREDGIHPEVSRIRLNDASARNILQRSTEGSTTELRYDKHAIQVLRVRSGRPTVVLVHLYRGDYLIPGKSSSSLRIEEPRT